MLAIVAWALFMESSNVSIIINGQSVTGPLKGAIGITGLLVSSVALFCLAILLAFIFAGIGLFVLGGVVLIGLVVAWLVFPFLLFLLIPLALVWVFIATTQGAKG
jgi:hypothetical protein